MSKEFFVKEAVNSIENLDSKDFEESIGVDSIELLRPDLDSVVNEEKLFDENNLGNEDKSGYSSAFEEANLGNKPVPS